MTERVVFDTSTLVGAALKSGSKPHRALLHALGSCTICSCEEELAELAVVLHRSSFDRYLSHSDRDTFLALVRERATFFELAPKIVAMPDPPCRDPRDNFILALALAAEADLIVSSDHDLLVLHPWRGIRIVTPSEFVAQFAA